MTWITGPHRRTRTKDILKAVNWLLINQLIYYQGFLSIYKVRKNRAPLFNFLQLNAGNIRRGRIGLTQRRWSRKKQLVYNTLHPSKIDEEKISLFKKKIKTWIKSNIGVFNSND